MQESFSKNNISDVISDKKGAFALFASLFLFIITLAGYGGLYYLNKSQDDTQAQLVQQVQQKEDDLRPQVLDKIYALRKKLKTIAAVIGTHQFTANTFSLLERDTHPRVSFDSYSFSPNNKSIVLKGKADNYSVLARQIAFFEGDQQINKVEFGGLSLGEDGRVSFNLTVYVLPTLTATAQELGISL